jgi:hypothetical protein
MKTDINAQAYKKNGSEIGVLISELFTRSTARITHPSKSPSCRTIYRTQRVQTKIKSFAVFT